MAKYIACEEEWLRLLVQELTPVMEHLQDHELPLSQYPRRPLSSPSLLLQ